MSVNKHFYVSWMAPYYYRVIPRLGWNSKAANKREGILRFELHHGTVGRKILASFPVQRFNRATSSPGSSRYPSTTILENEETLGTKLEIKPFFHMAISDANLLE